MKQLLLIMIVSILAGCGSGIPATTSCPQQPDAANTSSERNVGLVSKPDARDASNSKDGSRTKHRVNSYFSPSGEARDAMIREIDKAKREVLVALYYFTDPKMAEALVAAKKRGCEVRMVLDRTQANRKDSQAKTVGEAGIVVTFDRKHRIMHHKFCVIDRDTLMTGSQNWTESSQTVNAENTLIIHENRHLAGKYRTTFLNLEAINANRAMKSTQP